MTDRADEIARAYRQSYLLNITLAVASKMEGSLREACNAAETQFAAALRSYRDEALEEAKVEASDRLLDCNGEREALMVTRIVDSIESLKSKEPQG